MFSDYEQQIFDLIITHNIVFSATSVICYNQTIYDDMRLEMSEYLGLTLTVEQNTVPTYIPPKNSQVAIQILDNDSKQLIKFQNQHERSNTLLIINQVLFVNLNILTNI